MKQLKIIQNLDKKYLEELEKKANWKIPDWVELDSQNRKMKKKIKSGKNKKNCKSCPAQKSSTDNNNCARTEQPAKSCRKPVVEVEECDCTNNEDKAEVNEVTDKMQQLNQTFDKKVESFHNSKIFSNIIIKNGHPIVHYPLTYSTLMLIKSMISSTCDEVDNSRKG